MPRRSRVVIPGLPHHITHRSNRGEIVFRTDEDCEIYLRLLHKYALRYGIDIYAYCLMSNHIHLVAVPEEESSFAQAIGSTHGQYATIFNERHEMAGHLWHSRYFSCVLDESHFWNAIRYVELNPVRAGIMPRAEDYLWSSAHAHCRCIWTPLLSKMDASPPGAASWSSWLAERNHVGIDDRLRRRTISGLPCGSADFVHTLEHKVGRPLGLESQAGQRAAKTGTSPSFTTRNRETSPFLPVW